MQVLFKHAKRSRTMYPQAQQQHSSKQGRLRRVMTAMVLAGTLAMSAAAQAADRHVLVYNNTSSAMMAFYASNIDRVGWEEDILGNSVVRPGGSVRINVDDGTNYCLFDFKAVFADGSKAVKSNVNVCRINTFTFHE
jgi:hypothetical protein